MMQIRFQLSGTLEVPEGSKVLGTRAIMLPNGDVVKLFTAVELNDDRDLTYGELCAMDLDIEDTSSNIEVDAVV